MRGSGKLTFDAHFTLKDSILVGVRGSGKLTFDTHFTFKIQSSLVCWVVES